MTPFVLAQIELVEKAVEHAAKTPSDGSMSSWFAWSMGSLALVVVGGFVFMGKLFFDSNKAANMAFERLLKQVQDEAEAAEKRLSQAWDHHEKDREAYLKHQDEMSAALHKLVENGTQTHQKLDAIQDQIRRKRGEST